MLFTTPTQYAVLALCLVAGWLFGRASHSNRREKARLHEAETTHATYRRDAEARIKAAEAERDRLARAAPVTAQMVGTTGTTTTTTAPVTDRYREDPDYDRSHDRDRDHRDRDRDII